MYYILYSDKNKLEEKNVKIMRKYTYDPILYLLKKKKKSMYKCTCAVQAQVFKHILPLKYQKVEKYLAIFNEVNFNVRY